MRRANRQEQRRPRTTWRHRHRSPCPNASIREDAPFCARAASCRLGDFLPARDFLTVRCECAAHDAQNSYPQPHRCWARVSGARHRRAAVIAALTALTLPSTVPRSSPCAFPQGGSGHRTQTTAPAQRLARRAAARIARTPQVGRGAAGGDCDPGPAHHSACLVELLLYVTCGKGQTSSARCVKRALWCRSAHHGVRVCQPAA